MLLLLQLLLSSIDILVLTIVIVGTSTITIAFRIANYYCCYYGWWKLCLAVLRFIPSQTDQAIVVSSTFEVMKLKPYIHFWASQALLTIQEAIRAVVSTAVEDTLSLTALDSAGERSVEC